MLKLQKINQVALIIQNYSTQMLEYIIKFLHLILIILLVMNTMKLMVVILK